MIRRKTANSRRGNRRAATPGRAAGARTAGRRAGKTGWSCPRALTVREVVAAHRALLRLLPAAEPVRIDCSGLVCVDTAGAQLLAAFVRERRKSGRRVHLESAPGPLLEAARLLGLTELEAA